MQRPVAARAAACAAASAPLPRPSPPGPIRSSRPTIARRPRTTARPTQCLAVPVAPAGVCSSCGRTATARRTAAATAGDSDSAAPQEALLFDFFDQEIPYEQAWAWQRQRVDALASAGPQDRRDSVIILQHPPTYTLGAGSTEDNLRFDLAAPPHPIHRTERGGEVTYHGPGQLVVYPILDLTRHRQDLHWYLRSLEEVVIRALANVSGLEAGRVEGLTGVWVDGAKLCAIGVRARKWVTFHGLALNVVPDLAPFGLIVPCGIGDKPVGSVEGALAREAAAAAAAGGDGGAAGAAARPPWPRARPAPARETHWDEAQRELLLEYRYALVEALEEVFGLQLVAAGPEEVAALVGLEGAGSSGEEVEVQAGDGVPAAAHV